MIIQCDHCSAKFRMDDAKLSKGPVKVRCAKCKEVFVVRKEEEPGEGVQVPTDFGATVAEAAPQPPPPVTGEAPSLPEEPSAAEAGGFAAGGSDFTFSMEEPFASESGAPATVSKGHEGAADEFDFTESSGFDVSAPSAEFEQAPAAPGEFDFGEIPLGEPSLPAQPEETPAAGQDEFAIDFGEVSFSETPAAESAPPSFDFSFAPETEEEAPATRAAETGGAEEFALSFGAESPVPEEKTAPAEAKTETPFGEFIFGEPQVSEAPKPEPIFAPSEEKTGFPGVGGEFPGESLQGEELPPTMLTTRKKRGSLFPLFVIIGAILLIVALAGSGVYFFGGPKVFSKVGLGFLVEWYGQKGGEEGEIILRNVKPEYVVNKEAGELFVVRGEALNNYKKPRASIQIKVSLLGSNGTMLKAKTAFCGNPLSNEQLATMPPAKIDEVMNNQFGDSLANLGVKPGNAIPFVVVVSGIPKETSDFSVQVSGSTVATQ